ncbi:MAG TPA: hypothetical protein VFU11_13190 [Solirubrobacterales bacterium]|nr:hypothetical protein [Solirubrobacterales bacterium]
MPTTRPRHMITETQPLQEVLDQLRRVQGGEKVDFADLVIRGAEDKIRELRTPGSEATRQAGRELIEWLHSPNRPRPDLKAAEEVKYLGLEANYPE